MSEFRFNSTASLGAHLPQFTQDEIKNEPMLFACDVARAMRLGGPLTDAFVSKLSRAWLLDDVIIDSRVHMLMPGWFPCIPGWHHDDVPRDRADGQPNYTNPRYHAEHAMAIVGGGICPTQFALGEHTLPEVPLGEVYYRNWHPIISAQVATGILQEWSAPSNRLVFFDWQSMHQGTRAVAGGWRWFVRASRRTGRQPANELRKQVQVYLEAPMDGW